MSHQMAHSETSDAFILRLFRLFSLLLLFLLHIIIITIATVNSFPQGSPPEACLTLAPRHMNTSASSQASPFYFTASSGKFGGSFGFAKSAGIKGVYALSALVRPVLLVTSFDSIPFKC